MHLIDADNAADYLRRQGWVAPAERVQVSRMSGGVSNEVFYVEIAGRPEANFVLKQAREQLRTPDPWYCGVERIWREVEVLQTCACLLDAAHDIALTACTPRILFEDRTNFAFAMTAAPREHLVWKQQLLAGQFDPGIAAQCGRLLATLHAGSWNQPQVAERLGDRQIFDELRLDPYFRTVARAHPDFAPHFERLIDSVWQHPLCLVHADFSPKNLLVYSGGLMMVDFETGHYGDPAFDLGFFLSHLLLKAYRAAPRHEPLLELTERFWEDYAAIMTKVLPAHAYADLVARGIQNLAGCAWARVDGKSKVEYLTDARCRDQVRELCRTVLNEQPASWSDLLAACRPLMSNSCDY